MSIFSLNKYKTALILSIIVFVVFFTNTLVFASSSSRDLEMDITISIGDDGLIRLEDKKNSHSAEKTWNSFINQYKNAIVGFAAVAAISMVMFFIFKFVKLGIYADSPQHRSEIIRGLWTTGIATALLGATSLIVYIFYTMLN